MLISECFTTSKQKELVLLLWLVFQLLPRLLHWVLMLFSFLLVGWMGQYCNPRGFLCNESKGAAQPSSCNWQSHPPVWFLWLGIYSGCGLEDDQNIISHRDNLAQSPAATQFFLARINHPRQSSDSCCSTLGSPSSQPYLVL